MNPAIIVAVINFLSQVLPTVIEVVSGLLKSEGKGKDKRYAAVTAISEFVDSSFDDLPEWKELDEEQRDRMIAGWVETALFIIKVEGEGGKGSGKKLLKAALKKLKAAK